MNWYIAKLVFQIINNSRVHQFDEQVRLIKANDYNDAIDKALQMAKLEEDEFLNTDNHKVHWKFRAITHLAAVNSLENGSELCSKIFEKNPADNYLRSLKLKHQEITANLVASSN